MAHPAHLRHTRAPLRRVAVGLALLVGLLLAFAPGASGQAQAPSPRERALRFLLQACRPQQTYVLDRCAPGERDVSPHSAGLAALALTRGGAYAEAAASLDWLAARTGPDGTLPRAFDGPAGAVRGDARGEAEDLAATLRAGATLAQADPAYMARAAAWLDGLADALLALRRPDGRFALSPGGGPAPTRGANGFAAAALEAWAQSLGTSRPERAATLAAAAERARAILRGEVREAGPLNRRVAADFLWGLLWGGQTADGLERDRRFFLEVGWEASPTWGVRAQPGDWFVHPLETFEWAVAQARAGQAERALPALDTWALLQRPDGGFPEWVDLYVGARDPGPGTSGSAARFLLAVDALAGAGQREPRPAAALPAPLDALAPIRTTFDLIQDTSVDPPEPARLVRAAWSATANAVAGGLGPGPAPAATREEAWAGFEAAFSAQVPAAAAAGRVHPREAATQAILGMAGAVGDCHTGYFPNMRGALDAFVTEEERVGIAVELLEGGVVRRVSAGGPADRAGLRPGDTILAVDDAPYARDGAARIGGPPNTPVALQARRPGLDLPLVLVPVRRAFVERHVEGRLVAPGVGYLRVRRFADGLEGLTRPILESLAAQGARTWVIDLRDNGGGTVDELQRLAGKFLPPRQTLFWDRTRAGLEAKPALGEPFQTAAPVAVLANGRSYSASEIFASAFRDAGAPVVGGRTGGCVGTGQAFFLPDGAGFQVTIARMLTAAEQRSLDRSGLEPTVPAAETTAPADLAAGRDGPLDAAVAYLRTRLGA